MTGVMPGAFCWCQATKNPVLSDKTGVWALVSGPAQGSQLLQLHQQMQLVLMMVLWAPCALLRCGS